MQASLIIEFYNSDTAKSMNATTLHASFKVGAVFRQRLKTKETL